ncbi:MAG: hypothetical protein LBL33_01150 [Tannerella sp.]|jgi:RHS repeat-associated protein|nr:hypothetical protein [Tannerella sp.]
MKKVALSLLCILSVSAIYAQDEGNPFARYGYKARGTSTTIMGRSVLHDRQKVVAIGSVLFDAKADTIAGEFEPDTTVQWMDAQTVSMFIADIGRFTTPDPLAEKYYHISPYAYCANNPIKYIDPDGMDIVLGFQNDEARKALERIVNMGLEGQFKVVFNSVSDGKYSMNFSELSKDSKGDVSKMSEQGKAFYETMSNIINDHDVTVNMMVGYNTSDALVGNYNTGLIDAGDMEKFNVTGTNVAESRGSTQIGKLGHESHEQYLKQKHGYEYDPAHKSALNVEDRINGNTRMPDSERGSSRSGYITYKIVQNGQEYTVKYNIKGYNIKSVEQPKPSARPIWR